MCTAATYTSGDFYFGRNLDYEFSYGDEVVIVPRSKPFRFRHCEPLLQHYAMIGMAYVADGEPLYYDAINEKGLCIAGLNFVGNAFYNSELSLESDNICQFELIPWILGKCSTTDEAEVLLKRTNLLDEAFSDNLPVSDLHWIIADRKRCITVEYVIDGLRVLDNPVGVLTNNPPFEFQMFALNNYMSLSPRQPKIKWNDSFDCYSRGMGGMGLPGDLSSQSRFVRVAYNRANSISGRSEYESVSQFFHILESVEQLRGGCEVAPGKFEITLYSSCCNAEKGVYYYTTYNNHCISAVDMNRENLDATEIIRYPVSDKEIFNYIN